MGTQKSLNFECMRWTFRYVARSTLCKKRIDNLRHIEFRDTFIKLPGDTCNIIVIESKLQPLEGKLFDNKSSSSEDEPDYTSKLTDVRFKILLYFLQCLRHIATSCPKQNQEASEHHEAKTQRNEIHLRVS